MNMIRQPKDYVSNQEVRWCPGCGDYAILKAVQKTLSDLQSDPDQTVFVSGIGCAARLPYYIETYGFHTIHGRAAAVASGIKLANDGLDVWIVGGDGDSVSIGTNHFIHLLRRNLNVQYLLINNQIYGLTKGQASPTSNIGVKTPSTPKGNHTPPIHSIALALGAKAGFVARSGDITQQHLNQTLKRAHAYQGTGFVEILQNCIVYADGVFDPVLARQNRASNMIEVTHQKPLRFGQNNEKGLRLNPSRLKLEIVENASDDALLCHDETNPILAQLLGDMEPPTMPVAMGVLYCRDSSELKNQSANTPLAKKSGAFNEQSDQALYDMLKGANSWRQD
ncbi:MAG: 2-oxoacid:ferredoxin oxidoreductase subunit beta [Pseudomonadota bacterium]